MITANLFARMLGLLAISLAAGCASAYHSYPDGCVDCNYCPPSPLPFAYYDECVCHSCAAEPYLYDGSAAPVVDFTTTPEGSDRE